MIARLKQGNIQRNWTSYAYRWKNSNRRVTNTMFKMGSYNYSKRCMQRLELPTYLVLSNHVIWPTTHAYPTPLAHADMFCRGQHTWTCSVDCCTRGHVLSTPVHVRTSCKRRRTHATALLSTKIQIATDNHCANKTYGWSSRPTWYVTNLQLI